MEASRHYQPRRPNFLSRMASHWLERILGAVGEGSFGAQEEEYESGKTSRDYMWNSIGNAAWAMVFPLLTIVITQLVGAEQAGMFSLAFVTGTLLMIVANYGVRTYQVSDIDERHTFLDYQINRVLTCLLMLVVGVLYCTLRGYADEMMTISIGVYVYKMVDGWADVYEGRLQQSDKFYLAGISQTLRSVLTFFVFTVALLITRNLAVASVAMAVISFATLVVLTIPLALFETPKSRRWSVRSIATLFRQCFPVFIALFLYAFIDNMSKFVMEGVLTYDNQLYFNALYFPAQMILIVVQLIYKPLLVKLAAIWADPTMHKKFNTVLVAMVVAIVGVTAAMMLLMGWVGVPVMSALYGVDFEPFRVMMYIMLVAGGMTAAIDFFYQVITVLRRQRDVVRLYLIAFAVSIVMPLIFINALGLIGAVIAYLVSMSVLFVLLILEYLKIRADYDKDPKAESFDVVERVTGNAAFDELVPREEEPAMPSFARGEDVEIDAMMARRRRRAQAGPGADWNAPRDYSMDGELDEDDF